VGSDRIALTIGTSGAMRIIVDDVQDAPVSPRLWRYRLDRHSVVIGGALSNGGNILSWLTELAHEQDVDALEAAAGALSPDGHGLTVLPLLAGERSPSWDDRFGGTITGLRLDTSISELFRAFMESTAYRFASIYDGLLPLVAPEHDIYASGGAILRSPLWLQILADSLGHRMHALHPDTEASARGAAICALQAIGAIESIRLNPGPDLRSFEPAPSHHERYRHARYRLERLERMLAELAHTTPQEI
jgi:gluconokinase